jgi:Undecaprenyl-phosphate galactose phosphotransferase WbaP
MSSARMAPERLIPSPNEGAVRSPRSRSRNSFRQSICVFSLIFSDVLSIAVALRVGIFLRAQLVPRVDFNVSPATLPFSHYLDNVWLWLFFLIFLGVEGLYTQRRTLWNEVAHLAKAVTLALTAVFAATSLAQWESEVSRTTIVLTAAILLIVLPTTRYWTKRGLRAAGFWRKRILILGATDTARLAMHGLASDPVLGYEIAGVLDDDPMTKGKYVGTWGNKPVFVLDSLASASEQMNLTGARDILIAMPDLEERKLLPLVHELQHACESIYVVPQLWGLPMMNLRVDGFLRERLMMLKLSNNLAKPWNNWLKRMFDIVLGIMTGLLVLPLCLVVAALIKIDSGGPILFVQERLGYKDKVFRCFKFRTMCLNGDEMLIRHLALNPDAADEWHKYAKLRAHDPRLTRIGRFLRLWSLDELPQLWNVLKGDMSLVGPRPYLPQERTRIGMELPTILSSRPGMTGFWQVNGKNQLTLEDRVQLEAWYIRNWTIWFDCIILAKTFKAVLFAWTTQSPARSGPVPASTRKPQKT